MSLNKIKDIILSAKKIGITYHASPDGDAVGSVLALINGLRAINKKCYVISKEAVPENLKFLKGSYEITGEVTRPTYDTDVVVVLDCGNEDRVCADLKGFNGVLLNIDHHLSNDKYGTENYINTDAAATAEIVYELINLLGVDLNLISDTNINIGTCLFTSLVTDTGGFKFSNVTFKTLEIASKLRKIGVNNTYIYESLFDNKDFIRIKILAKVISRMKLVLNNKVALIEIPKSLGEEFGVEIGDTSDIISYGLQIKGVEVTVLVKESEEGTKISLRSKNYVDVRKIAEVFGGGGHTKASGLKIKDVSLNEAIEMVLNQIKKEL